MPHHCFILSVQTCHLYQVSKIGQALKKEDDGGIISVALSFSV